MYIWFDGTQQQMRWRFRRHVQADPFHRNILALALDLISGFERETARIDRIVRGLLDYSRPRRPTPTPIDVNESLRHVVDLLSAQGVMRRMEHRGWVVSRYEGASCARVFRVAA